MFYHPKFYSTFYYIQHPPLKIRILSIVDLALTAVHNFILIVYVICRSMSEQIPLLQCCQIWLVRGGQHISTRCVKISRIIQMDHNQTNLLDFMLLWFSDICKYWTPKFETTLACFLYLSISYVVNLSLSMSRSIKQMMKAKNNQKWYPY